MAISVAGSLLTRPAISRSATSRAPGRGSPVPAGMTGPKFAVSCGGTFTTAPPARRGGGGGGVDLSTLLRGFSVEDAVQSRLRAEHLQEKVRGQLLRVDDAREAMTTVDNLQRLGVDYHFEEEVGMLLNLIYEDHMRNINAGGGGGRHDLHDVALSFRLLRQGGFHVPTDAFVKFVEGKGTFKESISRNTLGLLSLHEASYLGVVGETLLDEAQVFSRKHLEASLDRLEPRVALQVRDALDHPYHMTHQRYKARKHLEQNLNHCDMVRKPGGGDGGGSLLTSMGEMARLDFGRVQTLHRRELLSFSKWWDDLGMSRDLAYARNQPMKWYVGAMATLSDPGLSSDHRLELAKCIALVHVIDDVFDVYASLEDLVLFTEAVNRWNLSEVAALPSYMQMCYATLYQVTNDIACKVHKEHGWNPINSLKKSWMILFQAFLVETRWFSSGHVPTAEEYLSNGVISSGAHVVLIHAFFLLGHKHNLTSNNVTWVEGVPSLISTTAMILRLWDDLGSAEDEEQDGFDGSYVRSYTKEHRGCTTADAKQHMMGMISTSWKRLNGESLLSAPESTVLSPPTSRRFSRAFSEACLNMARMVKAAYSYEKGSHQLPLLESFVRLLLLERAP